MDSRERCRIAMSGGRPDCVPVIPQICHPHAIRVLGLDFRKTIIDALGDPSLVNRLQVECARKYGADGVRVWMHADPVTDLQDDGQNVWQIDSKTRERIGRVDFQGGGWVIPIEEKPGIKTEEDIERLLPVTPAGELLRTEKFRAMKKIVSEAKKDLFVITSPGAMSFEYATFVRGKQQALLDIADRPDFVKKILSRATEISIENAFAMVEAGIDALMLGETFGGVIGPKQFKEFCLPYFKKFVEAIKPTGVLIYLHVCGNSTQLFELMADSGVDCIEPLDPLGGVIVSDAKKRVGNRVALMGGVNTVKLAHGSFNDVVEDIRRCLSEGAPGGGYLLACGDMLPTETLPEKVHAMVRMAHDWVY